MLFPSSLIGPTSYVVSSLALYYILYIVVTALLCVDLLGSPPHLRWFYTYIQYKFFLLCLVLFVVVLVAESEWGASVIVLGICVYLFQTSD